VSSAAGCSPVMLHSSRVPPWSLMPAATVPAYPGAAPPAPRPRPGRRGRMQWLRRFRSRHRSPARRCHPGQASPETHSLARNGLRPRNSEGTGLRGRSCLHDAQRPARNNAHAAVRRTPGQAGSGHRRPDAGLHLEGHPGLAAISRPRPVTPPRLGSRHRATSINSITLSDGEIRENARRPADRCGLRVFDEHRLKHADQGDLALLALCAGFSGIWRPVRLVVGAGDPLGEGPAVQPGRKGRQPAGLRRSEPPGSARITA
jgi:hypothetical protein